MGKFAKTAAAVGLLLNLDSARIHAQANPIENDELFKGRQGDLVAGQNTGSEKDTGPAPNLYADGSDAGLESAGLPDGRKNAAETSGHPQYANVFVEGAEEAAPEKPAAAPQRNEALDRAEKQTIKFLDKWRVFSIFPESEGFTKPPETPPRPDEPTYGGGKFSGMGKHKTETFKSAADPKGRIWAISGGSEATAGGFSRAQTIENDLPRGQLRVVHNEGGPYEGDGYTITFEPMPVDVEKRAPKTIYIQGLKDTAKLDYDAETAKTLYRGLGEDGKTVYWVVNTASFKPPEKGK